MCSWNEIGIIVYKKYFYVCENEVSFNLNIQFKRNFNI